MNLESIRKTSISQITTWKWNEFFGIFVLTDTTTVGVWANALNFLRKSDNCPISLPKNFKKKMNSKSLLQQNEALTQAIGLFSNDFKIPSKKVYWKLIKVSTQTSTSTNESALSYSRKIDQTFLLFANKYILRNVKSFKSDLSDSWICQTCPFNFCKFFAKEAQKNADSHLN